MGELNVFYNAGSFMHVFIIKTGTKSQKVKNWINNI